MGSTTSRLQSKSKSQCEEKQERTKSMNQFIIYYGYPSCINSQNLKWDIEKIADYVTQYDSVIFGGSEPSNPNQPGLHSKQHPDHEKTKSIISLSISKKPSMRFYGYITIGAGSHGSGLSFSLEELYQQIDEWCHLGCMGIFIDEAGFDYYNSQIEMRKRQIGILNYIHKKDKHLIFNVWNPNDLIVADKSSSLLPIPWKGHLDSVLYESYIFTSNTDTVSREQFSAYRQHMEGLCELKTRFNISLLACSTTSKSVTETNQKDFDFFSLAAYVDNFNSMCWSSVEYSAFGVDDGVIKYHSLPVELDNLIVNNASRLVDLENGVIKVDTSRGKLTLNFAQKSYNFDVPRQK